MRLPSPCLLPHLRLQVNPLALESHDQHRLHVTLARSPLDLLTDANQAAASSHKRICRDTTQHHLRIP
jgi:hypothetical protein